MWRGCADDAEVRVPGGADGRRAMSASRLHTIFTSAVDRGLRLLEPSSAGTEVQDATTREGTMRNHTKTIDADARFRNDIVEGPAGEQVLLLDPYRNLVELFQHRSPTAEA